MYSILSIDATYFFQHYLRSLSAKNANHLQTTDTLKRHQRYSIHYHCGWPSLGIWGSATHYDLPALPEPFLRACGLHRVCTRLKKIKAAEPFYNVQGDSMNSILSIDATYFFSTLSPLEKVPFATFYPPPDCLKSPGESWKVCTPIQGRQRILNPHWGYFYF